MKRTIVALFFAFGIMLFSNAIANNNNGKLNRVVTSDVIKHLDKDTYFDVKIIEFRFRKMNEQRRIVEFTDMDALKIEQFFMTVEGVLICETDAMDKTFKVISMDAVNGKEAFPYKELAQSLYQDGYMMIGMNCSRQEMFFQSSRQCNCEPDHRILQTNLVNPAPCNDCSDINISDEALEQFSTDGYGGTLINFDIDSTPPPSDSELIEYDLDLKIPELQSDGTDRK